MYDARHKCSCCSLLRMLLRHANVADIGEVYSVEEAGQLESCCRGSGAGTYNSKSFSS